MPRVVRGLEMQNMSARTVTGTTKVWLTEHALNIGPKELADPRVVSRLSYSDSEMKSWGWTLIGTAEITLHLVGDREIVENRVDSLRAEQKKVVADAQKKSTEIERQIQTLLAIAYEGKAA